MAFTLQDLGNIGEFLGAIGVIITLVYLALQIRQNTSSSRTTAEVSFGREFIDWHARISSQPELGRIWDVAMENPDALNKDEVRRFIFLIAEFFLICEGQYKLHQNKYISVDSWQAKTDVMLGLLRNSLVQQWWIKRMTPFSSEFIDYVDSLDHNKAEGWFPHVIASAAEPDSKPPT